MEGMKFFKEIKIKALDIIIILALFCASFSVFFLLPHNSSGSKVQLRVQGKVIKTFDLSKNQRWTYRSEDGDYNEIEVRDGEIAVIKASCRDQIDVQRGFISKVNDTIVCLPHELVIQIIGDQPESGVDYSG
ncbi:NusG domain II-containing protein [Lactococcus formosensis subsp. formosensis]|uniref:NusG domain II-containing protein n=1 Tax=Lactococcus formosensis TaxID=1281486 RepID=UPI0038521D3B